MTARIPSPEHRPPSRLWPLLFALLLSACGGGADKDPTVAVTATATAAPTAKILAAGGATGDSASVASATRKAVSVAASLRAKRGNVSTAAVATTVGPLRFTRQAGAPVTVTQTFSSCGGGCQLVVLNGDSDGSNRVSAATVYLNGQRVLAPKDFNQKVARLVVPIEAADATEIRVVLQSAPGAYLTVTVECSSFVALAIEDAPGIGVSTWDDGMVALAFPLVNEGTLAALGVRLTAMSAAPGNYQGPRPLAYTVGDIGPEEMQAVDGYFSGIGTSDSFPLRVNGTYQVGGATCSFEARANVVKPAAAAPVLATPRAGRGAVAADGLLPAGPHRVAGLRAQRRVADADSRRAAAPAVSTHAGCHGPRHERRWRTRADLAQHQHARCRRAARPERRGHGRRCRARCVQHRHQLLDRRWCDLH